MSCYNSGVILETTLTVMFSGVFFFFRGDSSGKFHEECQTEDPITYSASTWKSCKYFKHYKIVFTRCIHLPSTTDLRDITIKFLGLNTLEHRKSREVPISSDSTGEQPDGIRSDKERLGKGKVLEKRLFNFIESKSPQRTEFVRHRSIKIEVSPRKLLCAIKYIWELRSPCVSLLQSFQGFSTNYWFIVIKVFNSIVLFFCCSFVYCLYLDVQGCTQSKIKGFTHLIVLLPKVSEYPCPRSQSNPPQILSHPYHRHPHSSLPTPAYTWWYNSSGSRGRQGGHPPQPAKTSCKKDGCRMWQLIFHVPWPPSPKFLDPLLYKVGSRSCDHWSGMGVDYGGRGGWG